MTKLPVKHTAGEILGAFGVHIFEIVSTTTFKNGCSMRKIITCATDTPLTTLAQAQEAQRQILHLYKSGRYLDWHKEVRTY